jgi:hypothetical protein
MDEDKRVRAKSEEANNIMKEDIASITDQNDPMYHLLRGVQTAVTNKRSIIVAIEKADGFLVLGGMGSSAPAEMRIASDILQKKGKKEKNETTTREEEVQKALTDLVDLCEKHRVMIAGCIQLNESFDEEGSSALVTFEYSNSRHTSPPLRAIAAINAATKTISERGRHDNN